MARREGLLASLAEEIAAAGRSRPTVLSVDLGRRDAVSTLAAEPTSPGLEPGIVVNNAGFGLAGPAAALSRDEQLAMIDLNVRALTELLLAYVESLAPSSRRHSQRRLGRRFHARSGHGRLLRQQGLCALPRRGVASRAVAARRQGHRDSARGRSRPSFKRGPACAASASRPRCYRFQQSAWRALAITLSFGASAWSCPVSVTKSRYSCCEWCRPARFCVCCTGARGLRLVVQSSRVRPRLEFTDGRDTRERTRPRFRRSCRSRS